MTVDDEKSVYVGGLPYDISENELRREFDLYGSIVSVKIVNDREIGGKCYGFVTFTNPRSVMDAINDMNGKRIGGRVVKVNEVKTRVGVAGRSNYGRDIVVRRNEWDMDRNKGRARERVSDAVDRDRYHDRDRDRSGGVDRERERRYEGADFDNQSRDLQDRDRDQQKNFDEREQTSSRDHSREWDRDRSADRHQGDLLDRVDRDRKDDNRSEQRSEKRSRTYDERSRDVSLGSADYHQLEQDLELTIQRKDDLQKGISEMEERLKAKRLLTEGLRKRSVKLEDELTSAKKLSSLRQKQMTKLHKCYLQVKDCGERFKTAEQDLQDLVQSIMLDLDAGP